MVSDVTSSKPPPAGSDTTDATGHAPSIDLGSGFTARQFTPGRYAVAVQLSRRGTHAHNRVSESSTMSLVLELAGDGSATACRGWDYAFTNDGSTVHTEDRFREQLGFRGRYAVRDGVAEAELVTDDGVCPAIAEYTKGVPRRQSTMKLRCVTAMARTGSPTVPVLLCDWQDANTPEVEALRVREAAPRPWLILGSGNGLRIKLTGAPPKLIGEPTRVTMEVAPTLVEAGAWQHPF
jgi:hypothetical protein